MRKDAITLAQLDVSREDIQEMHDRYDSGMFDRTTANAVSLALRRKLQTEENPKVIFARHHNACELRIGSENYPLPQDLYWWLRHFDMGKEMRPARFMIAIPSKFLKEETIVIEEDEAAIAA